MEKRNKKSLTSSLHDRATTSSSKHYPFSRQNSKSSLIQIQNRLPPLFVTMEQYEKLQKKIETLENEAIRHNKVLNMYIERIEELEITVKKLEEHNKKQQQILYQQQQQPKLQQDTSPSFYHQNHIDSINNIMKSQLNRTVNTHQSTSIPPPPNVTNSPTSVHRLSVMPSVKEKKRTPKKLMQLSEVQNASHIDGCVGNGGFWTKFTQFFKYRPSVEALKEQNIYQNEPCFDTELENVVKHEEHPTIPKIIVECVRLIEFRAKKKPTEGLYRMSGDHVEIQKIRFLIDGNDYECLNNIKDIHTIVGVLKLFLREIKDPLVNVSEIKLFIGSARDWTLAAVKMKIMVLQKLVKSLPEQNRDTLSYLLKHLHKLTRMPLQFVNSRSLAVSLTPTIFHFTIANNADIHTTMKENEALTSCLEIMIEYEDKIFETSFGRVLSKQMNRKWPSCPCINPGRVYLKAIQ